MRFKILIIQLNLDEQSRQSIISHIGTTVPQSGTTKLIRLRLYITSDEVCAITRLVTMSPTLVDIQIRRGATDNMMETIGRYCHSLQELNM